MNVVISQLFEGIIMKCSVVFHIVSHNKKNKVNTVTSCEGVILLFPRSTLNTYIVSIVAIIIDDIKNPIVALQ